ncbi:MAG: BUG/TctC family periplasmic protein, partial [uncultured Craurococcus sp.]
ATPCAADDAPARHAGARPGAMAEPADPRRHPLYARWGDGCDVAAGGAEAVGAARRLRGAGEPGGGQRDGGRDGGRGGGAGWVHDPAHGLGPCDGAAGAEIRALRPRRGFHPRRPQRAGAAAARDQSRAAGGGYRGGGGGGTASPRRVELRRLGARGGGASGLHRVQPAGGARHPDGALSRLGAGAGRHRGGECAADARPDPRRPAAGPRRAGKGAGDHAGRAEPGRAGDPDRGGGGDAGAGVLLLVRRLGAEGPAGGDRRADECCAAGGDGGAGGGAAAGRAWLRAGAGEPGGIRGLYRRRSPAEHGAAAGGEFPTGI